MGEGSTEDRERSASHANRLRNDPGFILAVEAAKEQIMKEITQTQLVDTAAREALYYEHRALDRVVSRLKSLATVPVKSTAYRSVA